MNKTTYAVLVTKVFNINGLVSHNSVCVRLCLNNTGVHPRARITEWLATPSLLRLESATVLFLPHLICYYVFFCGRTFLKVISEAIY